MALWTEALDCYLEELYVVPDRRGQGLGRALVDAAIGYEAVFLLDCGPT